MVACRDLGYLSNDRYAWDCTYGEGTFWKLWSPARLFRTDIDPNKSPDVPEGVDFTNSGYPEEGFQDIIMDAPYKLNGTERIFVDKDIYGVAKSVRWQDRMDLILRGVSHLSDIIADGYLLIKCQDQVCSGKVVWQTDEITTCAASRGLRKVDRLDMLSYRPQPLGTRQIHARRNSSTLLVFKRK